MDLGIISKHYAKALLDYAVERGAEDVVYDECRCFVSHFAGDPRLRQALENPILTAQEKTDLIVAATHEDGKTSTTYANFIRLVLQHHREGLFRLMCLIYMDLYRQMKHIGVAALTTAVPVDAETKKRIRQTAAHIIHADVELQTHINPDILGGFIFDINDYRIDASVAMQLKRVKKQLIARNKRIV
ncbi:MAG: F0F1 ATP synthase subunit delta [Prevotellaceae bacterium]|jgi:F-type H+-transporting ATPase subunit delta|nr:F0F1 ATP synthase subunit delta [Prevotellaceae bacterium]